MKGLLRSLLIIAAVGVAVTCRADERYVPVVDKTIHSVVRINVLSFYEGKVRQWTGSGVIISTNGHILTCNHVVEGDPIMLDVRVYGSTVTSHGATIIRKDALRDLALIKLDDSTPVSAVRLSSTPPVIGQEVIAIGHPDFLDWSVTKGIVSGLHRDGLAINLLQTDAAINPGNSGGPLFNLDGEVVGINESVMKDSDNLGFAVPVEEIRAFLEVFQGLEVAF